MSRIDEALRRSSARPDHRDTSIVADSQAYRSEEPGLARYPREIRHDGTTVVGEDRPASKTIAAPRVGGRGQFVPFNEDLNGKLIMGASSPVAVEQYRRLAASLHDLQSSRGVKTLMVTSALPREGKTLTLTNLALTLSESYGRRVLIIDADLRRPSLHEVFRLPNSRGLSDSLRSGGSEISLLQVSSNLSVLPAGRADHNPMAGLTSERMRVLLEESAKKFDWVLLDAPPVGIMPDADLLARLTEGVVFVISAGTTPYQYVESAIEQIGRENIVGTVLNRADQGAIDAAGYYHEYYAPPSEAVDTQP
jgi:capsular exopolysaccharide synthesis family protein